MLVATKIRQTKYPPSPTISKTVENDFYYLNIFRDIYLKTFKMYSMKEQYNGNIEAL